MRAYGVVPFWANFVVSYLDRFEVRRRNRDSRFVRLLELRGSDGQIRAYHRAANETQYGRDGL